MDGWTGGDGCVVVMMVRADPRELALGWSCTPRKSPTRKSLSLTLLECQMRCRLASLLCSRA